MKVCRQEAMKCLIFIRLINKYNFLNETVCVLQVLSIKLILPVRLHIHDRHIIIYKPVQVPTFMYNMRICSQMLFIQELFVYFDALIIWIICTSLCTIPILKHYRMKVR